MSQTIHVRKVAEADFPTRFGHFRILGFEGLSTGGALEEAVVLKMGELSRQPAPGAHPFPVPDRRRVPQPALRLPRAAGAGPALDRRARAAAC